MNASYTIAFASSGSRYIECHTCGKRSYNPNDITQKYCGNCHQFHDILGHLVQVSRSGPVAPPEEKPRDSGRWLFL